MDFGSYAHKGISVDIYKTVKINFPAASCWVFAPASPSLFAASCGELDPKRLKKSKLEDFLKSENKAYLCRRKDKGLISEKEYIKRMTKPMSLTKSSAEENGDLMVYAFVSPYECHYMRSDCVFPLKKYMIRDVEFYGSSNADKILRDIYGDYMQLPPKEKRRWHYSSVHFLK